MHPCVHAFHHVTSSFKKWIQTFSQDKCVAQASPMIGIHVMFADTWKSSSGYPFLTTLSLGLVKSKSSFHRDPLLMNGQVLCSPFGQRPSPWEWLGPGYDPLRENSHRFLCLFLRIGHIVWRIETLYSVMVTESFQI